MTHIPFLFSQNSVFTGFIRKEISEDDEDEEELERNHISFVISVSQLQSGNRL